MPSRVTERVEDLVVAEDAVEVTVPSHELHGTDSLTDESGIRELA